MFKFVFQARFWFKQRQLITGSKLFNLENSGFCVEVVSNLTQVSLEPSPAPHNYVPVAGYLTRATNYHIRTMMVIMYVSTQDKTPPPSQNFTSFEYVQVCALGSCSLLKYVYLYWCNLAKKCVRLTRHGIPFYTIIRSNLYALYDWECL